MHFPFGALVCVSLQIAAVTALAPWELRTGGWQCAEQESSYPIRDLTGIVTAIGGGHLWIRGVSDRNDATSDSVEIMCFRNKCDTPGLARGMTVTVAGTVDCEYREFTRNDRNSGDELPTTIVRASSIVVGPQKKAYFAPVVLGVDRVPPKELYTDLDAGLAPSSFFLERQPVSRLTEEGGELKPKLYGMDFWKSLEGEYVRIQDPVAVAAGPYPGNGFWVVGSWAKGRQNSRGGLTLTMTADGSTVDAHPEAIFVSGPLTTDTLPGDLTIGTTFWDIDGVLTYRFGSWRVLPIDRPRWKVKKLLAMAPVTSYWPKRIPRSQCEFFTVVTYNLRKLKFEESRITGFATQIVSSLGMPSVMFLQEIGNDNDDKVSKSVNILQTLSDKIVALGGPLYKWAVVEPEGMVGDREDSPEVRKAVLASKNAEHFAESTAENMRNVIFYRDDTVELAGSNPGGPSDSMTVIARNGRVTPSFNPGFIDPDARAYLFGRKTLAVVLKSKITSRIIWAINVHLNAKAGVTMHSDIRPPRNKALSWRVEQLQIVDKFVQSIQTADPDAMIVLAGDFNESQLSAPVFDVIKPHLASAADLARMPATEQYTFVHQMTAHMLDHVFVSHTIADGQPVAEVVHLNTWDTFRKRASDHDPFLVGWKMCTKGSQPAAPANAWGLKSSIAKST